MKCRYDGCLWKGKYIDYDKHLGECGIKKLMKSQAAKEKQICDDFRVVISIQQEEINKLKRQLEKCTGEQVDDNNKPKRRLTIH